MFGLPDFTAPSRESSPPAVIKWQDFSAALNKKMRSRLPAGVTIETGVPEQTITRAMNGRIVSAASFLALCLWMKHHPMRFLDRRNQ